MKKTRKGKLSKVSKSQALIKSKLISLVAPLGYSIISEDEDKKVTSIKLANGNIHIADFYIPELKLFIEYSGNNYVQKLIKMTRAHAIININYFAFVALENKEMEVDSIDKQFNYFSYFIKSNEITAACNYSSYIINKLSDHFYKLQIESRTKIILS